MFLYFKRKIIKNREAKDWCIRFDAFWGIYSHIGALKQSNLLDDIFALTC